MTTDVEFYQDLVDKAPVISDPFATIDEMFAAAAAMEILSNGENSKKRASPECKNDPETKKVALNEDEDLVAVSVSSVKDADEIVESDHDDKIPPFAIVAANDEEIPAIVEDDAFSLNYALIFKEYPIEDKFERDSALDEENPVSSDDLVDLAVDV